MPDQYITVIVPASEVQIARDIAASFGPGGQQMLTTALSQTGSEPATHYISSGKAPPQLIGVILDARQQGSLEKADTSADNPFDAMTRMGLKIITAEEPAT